MDKIMGITEVISSDNFDAFCGFTSVCVIIVLLCVLIWGIFTSDVDFTAGQKSWYEDDDWLLDLLDDQWDGLDHPELRRRREEED